MKIELFGYIFSVERKIDVDYATLAIERVNACHPQGIPSKIEAIKTLRFVANRENMFPKNCKERQGDNSKFSLMACKYFVEDHWDRFNWIN
jgi:hypothetical protein